MISFFERADFFRFTSLVVMVLLLRLPILLGNYDLQEPDLYHMILGEKLSSGDLIYRDVLDNTEPLSALAYAGIDAFFGRSVTAYLVLATALTLYLVLYFAGMCLQTPVFTDRNLVPAFVLLLFIHAFHAFISLSPALMGLCFLLPGLDCLFRLVRGDQEDTRMFKIGFYFAVAFLFFWSSILYVVYAALTIMLFTSIRPRKLLLLIWGFLFPLLVIFVFFYWYDGITEYSMYVFSQAYITRLHIFNPEIFFWYLFPFVFIMVLSFVKLSSERSFTNYQVMIQQSMMLLILLCMGSLFVLPNGYLYNCMVFIPPVVFFSTHYFQLVKRPLISNFIGFGLLIYIVYGLYDFASFPAQNIRLANLNQETMLPDTFPYRQKKVLNLSAGFAPYQHNKMVTRYLNWNLSKETFIHLEYYFSLIEVYRELLLHPPDVIAGNRTIVETLRAEAPYFEKHYKEKQKGIYVFVP